MTCICRTDDADNGLHSWPAFPEQAYLFDAIARELALPMLQDVLSAVEGHPVFFRSSGAMRL
jgi:hypothetical protein